MAEEKIDMHPITGLYRYKAKCGAKKGGFEFVGEARAALWGHKANCEKKECNE